LPVGPNALGRGLLERWPRIGHRPSADEMAEVGNVRHSARNASRVAALADSAPAASRRSAAAI